MTRLRGFRVDERLQFRVVKIGGSLLATRAIERIPEWLADRPNLFNILVVGGGEDVNQIRVRQPIEGISDAVAHWRSIALMRKTAASVSSRLKTIGHDFPVLERLEAVGLESYNASAILDVEAFLRQDAKQPDALPLDWTVTSDSIAAKIASVVCAVELVLLKSITPPATSTVTSIADDGIVDQYFPVVFDRPQLKIVNARLPDWPECTLVSCSPKNHTGD